MLMYYISFIYLSVQGSECLCIPKILNGTLTTNSVLLEQENAETCNQSCAGNNGDLCGGPSVVDGKLLYSVFQVLQSMFKLIQKHLRCFVHYYYYHP